MISENNEQTTDFYFMTIHKMLSVYKLSLFDVNVEEAGVAEDASPRM